MSLSYHNKKETTNTTYKNILNEVLIKLPDHIPIFTDASKTDKGVGIAVVIQQTELSERLTNDCNIYSAEALAIYKALSYIINANLQNKKYIIFTDSMSTIASLININNNNVIVNKIINLIHKFINYIIFA